MPLAHLLLCCNLVIMLGGDLFATAFHFRPNSANRKKRRSKMKIHITSHHITICNNTHTIHCHIIAIQTRIVADQRVWHCRCSGSHYVASSTLGPAWPHHKQKQQEWPHVSYQSMTKDTHVSIYIFMISWFMMLHDSSWYSTSDPLESQKSSLPPTHIKSNQCENSFHSVCFVCVYLLLLLLLLLVF